MSKRPKLPKGTEYEAEGHWKHVFSLASRPCAATSRLLPCSFSSRHSGVSRLPCSPHPDPMPLSPFHQLPAMHCPRLYLAFLLPFFVVPATAVPAASAATQAFGFDNALQLGAEGRSLPLAPVPAASEPFTNGERFKRGLPPAAPKKRGYRALGTQD